MNSPKARKSQHSKGFVMEILTSKGHAECSVQRYCELANTTGVSAKVGEGAALDDHHLKKKDV